MKSRNILILALVMALITTFLFNKYLKDIDMKYKKSQNKITVVTAKNPILKNEKVTRDMLVLKEISEEAVLSDSVKSIELVEGKYALADISQGETLLSFRFTSEYEEEKQITRKIRDGFRALSVEVNFVESVSNLIQPEDYVDIIFSENIRQDAGKNNITTEITLENVRILAVGKSLTEQSEQKEQESSSKNNEKTAVQYTSVTLELKPEDAVKLINNDERGNIKLVLRSKIEK
jgi:pilus assembly protein CpaB